MDLAFSNEDERRKPRGPGRQIQPGQVLNPAGRPKGSRNKLGEQFLTSLQAHWEEHGDEAIQQVYERSPVAYVRIVASILPKQFHIRDTALDKLSGDELDQLVEVLRAARAKTIEQSK